MRFKFIILSNVAFCSLKLLILMLALPYPAFAEYCKIVDKDTVAVDRSWVDYTGKRHNNKLLHYSCKAMKNNVDTKLALLTNIAAKLRAESSPDAYVAAYNILYQIFHGEYEDDVPKKVDKMMAEYLKIPSTDESKITYDKLFARIEEEIGDYFKAWIVHLLKSFYQSKFLCTDRLYDHSFNLTPIVGGGVSAFHHQCISVFGEMYDVTGRNRVVSTGFNVAGHFGRVDNHVNDGYCTLQRYELTTNKQKSKYISLSAAALFFIQEEEDRGTYLGLGFGVASKKNRTKATLTKSAEETDLWDRWLILYSIEQYFHRHGTMPYWVGHDAQRILECNRLLNDDKHYSDVLEAKERLKKSL